MNDQTPTEGPSGPSDDGSPASPELTEAEREALEQQMKEIRVEDLLAQTVASVLNLSARRLLKEDEVDLEQARVGIEAVRSLTALLPEEVGAAVREPLSQLQMLYAQKSGGPGPAEPADPKPGAAGSGPVPGGSPPEPERPGGSGLWVPGRD